MDSEDQDFLVKEKTNKKVRPKFKEDKRDPDSPRRVKLPVQKSLKNIDWMELSQEPEDIEGELENVYRD